MKVGGDEGKFHEDSLEALLPWVNEDGVVPSRLGHYYSAVDVFYRDSRYAV